MSWCPKCKNEYRAGIEICPDCNEVLVEELSEENSSKLVPLFQTTDPSLLDKVVKYLIHCKINAKGLPVPKAEEPVWVVLVPEDEAKEAAMEVQTVLMYEAKEKEKAENGGVEKPKPKKGRIPVSNLHLTAKDRYEEYKSSGIMLIVFSILLIIFAVLNILGIVTIMSALPSLIVLFLIAAAFLYLGISSLMSTKKILKEAGEEEKATNTILSFLKENFPKETLEAMREDDLSDELLYFKQLGAMKEALNEQCPDADENYIDAILDEYFNSLNI